MSLPAPILDDRDFQSLVNEAKLHVQRACPEWTDHNVSDPGITLIEAFAAMTDQLIYRLNRVPDRHYLKFLELIGLRLFPPSAARGTVTFWLSAAQPNPVVVRAGAEVATPRTDTDQPVVFSTLADLRIVPCEFSRLATAGPDGAASDQTRPLAGGQQVPCFSPAPRVGDAVLVGLSAAVPSCAVLLRVDCPVGGVGIDPLHAPLRWEAWTDAGWQDCEVERDETGGFNRTGDVVLHVPAGHTMSVQARERAGWLRCIVVPSSHPAYTRSPRLAAVRAMTIGGTAQIAHAETVNGELLGVSDGTPGQRFVLQRTPVASWPDPVMVLAEAVGGGESHWLPVEDFARSGPQDRHYLLDAVAGEITFGPAVRQHDGTVRQYGAIPPKGALLRASHYRVGGGQVGNVARGAIRVLKTSVPYVSRVENRHPAAGGVDGETIDNARLRGPLELRASGRAVTAADFETLARQVAPDAARVQCLPAVQADGIAAGVRLLVVPQVSADHLGRIDYTDVTQPPQELMERIGLHLDARRLVGTRLVVEPPAYRGVTVVVRLTAVPQVSRDRVAEDALRALYLFLSPVAGGPDGHGWPFGRPVQAFDLSAVLSHVPGVSIVDNVLLFPADPRTGERGEPVPRIELGPYELAFPYAHQVRVTS